ncbi:hypothetical protein VOLCADRAFT_98177 [Volvox carteri f. nagariensis]|uniref:Sugar phosphate transporter domain-containing protein n=1 Tax=Volvox carteri f. nagariensis TaxID=3068 RepID=D8UEN1_VOLCA|nr:uncharacterized protein VOLCADRAFT_98177 [Volvox carteri f. nagariensis]EFJ41796.1 hypothetical protein VOLCADRAFT_98177 [Volvox carteri f. nagariensis]|eukprot:XP_002957142.1 hypothetical protein VOLCADRAFT_98177 [Volvox carteri f. nagariensis]
MADPKEEKLAMDIFAWFLNVSTSVLIVFVNKVLMDPKIGYRFVFATTLCAFHFLACGASVKLMELFGYGKRATMPMYECIRFAVIASVSIASLNLSLLVNSVGFYQISKLLITPFVGLAEYLFYKRRFTAPTVISILTVVTGVAIVTVNDVSTTVLGLVIAAISVVTSGLQQLMCGEIQKRLSLTSTQLLSNTAPVQGAMLMMVGPFVDKAVTSRWLKQYDWSVPALTCLFWSCAVAVLVNVSQFMCLGRFSAITFQVTGHTKTVLVLLCGRLFLGETIGARKLIGMVTAVLGMVAYGYFNSLPVKHSSSIAGGGAGTGTTAAVAGSGAGSGAGGGGGGGGSKRDEDAEDDGGLREPLLMGGGGGSGSGSSVAAANGGVAVQMYARPYGSRTRTAVGTEEHDAVR